VSYQILCAYDDTPAAEKAFSFAVTLARSLEAVLHVLAVFTPSEAAQETTPEALSNAARERFSASFKRLEGQVAGTGLTVRFATRVGYAAQQIVHHARELQVDHIVMGHRPKNLFGRGLVESVSQRVVLHAACAVTVIR
jgi:nucleotide-binding universal stress UspA family protein